MRRKIAISTCALGLLVSAVLAPTAGAAKHHRACSLINKPPLCISLG